MPQVLVREITPDLLARLKARAKRNGRSLQGEVRQILQQAERSDAASARERIEQVRKLFEGQSWPDPAQLVRRDREHGH